jgi:hypothetical protein
MMRCDRQNMTVTTSGCARLWKSALVDKPHPWEGRLKCVACPVGAAHAGQPITVAVEAAATWRMICPRCFRPATRLIHGDKCISCYNRHCEALRGRNAKGNRPQLCDRLHTQQIAVVEGGRVRSITQPMVTSPSEVMINAIKNCRSAMAFGVRRFIHPVGRYRQMSFAL